MIDGQKDWTPPPKKGEVGVTLNSDFHSNVKHRKPTDGVDSLETHNKLSRGTVTPS